MKRREFVRMVWMVMEGRGWGGRVRGVGDSGRDREVVAEDIMHPGGRWVCMTKSGIRYIVKAKEVMGIKKRSRPNHSF